MHILFLTQILPYPPTSGPKVKTWHVLRYLSERGHKITLASFVRPEELHYIEDVKKVCVAVHAVPVRRSRVSNVNYLLRSQFTGRPFLVERDDLTYQINHVASVRLAELAKQVGVARFLFSSSCCTYGAAADDEMLTEEAAFNPVTPYGHSKVLVEQDVAKLADDHFSPAFLRINRML